MARILEGSSMKIEELIAGKKDGDAISIEWCSIPVSSLRKLMQDGYLHLRPYQANKTFSLWGKNCSACFTEEQLRERA